MSREVYDVLNLDMPDVAANSLPTVLGHLEENYGLSEYDVVDQQSVTSKLRDTENTGAVEYVLESHGDELRVAMAVQLSGYKQAFSQLTGIPTDETGFVNKGLTFEYTGGSIPMFEELDAAMYDWIGEDADHTFRLDQDPGRAMLMDDEGNVDDVPEDVEEDPFRVFQYLDVPSEIEEEMKEQGHLDDDWEPADSTMF